MALRLYRRILELMTLPCGTLRGTRTGKRFFGCGTANQLNDQLDGNLPRKSGILEVSFRRWFSFGKLQSFPETSMLMRGSGKLSVNHLSDNKKFSANRSVNYVL